MKNLFEPVFLHKILRLAIAILFAMAIMMLFHFCISFPLFKVSYSTAVFDWKGELIGARIAKDGQWRFPQNDSIPKKFEKALLQFEDKIFYDHNGIDILAFANAVVQNIKSRKVVRGASTLTMQTARLSAGGGSRNIFKKAKEIIQAWRIEIKLTKKEILNEYISHAPFGGNVVGLEAASWRYFGQSPGSLSWAESATLAVLPNSPSLIYPGKNQQKLKIKRNALLLKLFRNKIISNEEYQLAIAETLPQKPFPLPSVAPHFTEYLIKSGYDQKKVSTTIHQNLQKKINEILDRHHQHLSANQIYNAAALVVEVETGDVISYNGNILNKQEIHGYNVDVIQAERSTGSILKPLLFGLVLQEGKYLPSSLIPDIPTIISGYAPKNFYPTYDGVVSLRQSISRSLNVPAVRLLQEYGVEKFHHYLKQLGVTTLHFPASHYGLSIILGGAEATLWDLAGIYQKLAKNLNQFSVEQNGQGRIAKSSLNFLKIPPKNNATIASPLDATSIWCMMEAMNDVSRPEEETSWKDYTSSYRIAWKTGTSFGYRDGWAIGCTPQHVVAVWVGNCSGEGRPALTGISAAAPIMFDIFKNLKSANWFYEPRAAMSKEYVCTKSGYIRSENCEEVQTMYVQNQGKKGMQCPFHKNILLDKNKKYRVNPDCEILENRILTKWFTLPPTMERYYKTKNSQYVSQPDYRSDCQPSTQSRAMEIIYPVKGSKIILPVKLDEKVSNPVFEISHKTPSTKVLWYIDENYIGYTKDFHQLKIKTFFGEHVLTVVDESGERAEVKFSVGGND